jgi:hypothetical protein
VRVLPRVVFVVAALGLAGSLTGCAQFNKALGQQQALVSFKSGTPVSVRLQVRAACDRLPNVSAAPIPRDVPVTSAVSVIVYKVTGASNADIARLQVCLSKFPSVQGLNLQDSSDNS